MCCIVGKTFQYVYNHRHIKESYGFCFIWPLSYHRPLTLVWFPYFLQKKCQAHSQLQIFASWFSVSDYQPLWWWWCLSVMSDSLWPHGLLPARLFCPCNPPCKNIRVGCHLFLQGTFPTQGLNLSLCIQADSLPFKPLGKPHQLFSSLTKSRGKIFHLLHMPVLSVLQDAFQTLPPSQCILGKFSRQEYWSGLLYPLPGDFPNSGIEPRSPALQVDS